MIRKYKGLGLATAGLLASSAALAQTPTRPKLERPVPSGEPTARAAKERADGAEGAFVKYFDEDAKGYNARNAYVLAYVSALVYPDGLMWHQKTPSQKTMEDIENAKKTVELQVNKGNIFEAEFRRVLQPMFGTDTTFNFLSPSKPNRDGYDPEAMLIETPKALIVVFRGTDRVGTSSTKTKLGKFMFDWGEWIRVDFRATYSDPGKPVDGQVHEGMWRSMTLELSPGAEFRDEILKAARAAQAKKKKIWVTGHSLGGGYAQLFTGFAEGKGVPVQGTFVYAAPHVFDAAFAKWLDGKLGGGKQLQRFEFLSDPITQVGPSPIFGRAGQRNHFTKISELKLNEPERPWVAFVYDHMCYHRWQWYVAGAFQALPKADRKLFPRPLALPPLPDMACNQTTNRNAIHGDAVVDLAEKAAAEFEKVTCDITNLVDNVMDNLSGSAIEEGTYYLRCLQGKKYLDVSWEDFKSEEDGGKVQLYDIGNSKANNKFKIVKHGAAYLIKSGDMHVELDGNDLFDSSGRVQTWDPVKVFMTNNYVPNQTWYFCKVPKTSNQYVIVNGANFKVLDAVNSGVNKNGGKVQLYKPVDNDPTQIWIVEKAK